jgi:hypothetical protein
MRRALTWNSFFWMGMTAWILWLLMIVFIIIW